MQKNILTMRAHLLIEPVKGLLLAQMVGGGADLIGKLALFHLGPCAGLQLVPDVVGLDELEVIAPGLHAVQGGGVSGVEESFPPTVLRCEYQVISAVWNIVDKHFRQDGAQTLIDGTESGRQYVDDPLVHPCLQQGAHHPLTAAPPEGGPLPVEGPHRPGLEMVAVGVGEQDQFQVLLNAREGLEGDAAVNEDTRTALGRPIP